ncbi:hypothetical protein Q0590_28460 [Rhodocytophaga aerolata]|uniref:Uncharacterized protein n=1 Tax=Rhodocytophaga aerolata TaxID=455078 RepID=A0ABT8RDS4_9BACT|nr:hypothetical protein [Rhodocytophaga aerolata]MDO1450247.1 hypothetical protein [Rhodocytophaga aerolata]
MLDEEKQQVKSLLWTKYYLISMDTGRKAVHSPELLSFFGKLLNQRVNPSAGFSARVTQVRSQPVAG